MRTFAIASTLVLLVALGSGEARAEEPGDLDALVSLAIARHPEVAALDLDAEAARSRAVAAGRPMDLQWMLGARALGAMPESVDPTMGMVGAQQMFSFPGVYAASRDRAALDAQWALRERARVEADVREALWESAARLRALAVQAGALDEAIRAAEAAVAFGRARYGAGAVSPVPAP